MRSSKIILLFFVVILLFPIPIAWAWVDDPAKDYPNEYLVYLRGRFKEQFNAFQCYPQYGHGDYYNYWMDDAGKLLIAFNLAGDFEYSEKAVNFIKNMVVGGYLPARYVNSTLYYSGSPGGDFYASNMFVGIGNATKDWGERTAPGLEAYWPFNGTGSTLTGYDKGTAGQQGTKTTTLVDYWKFHNGTIYGDAGWVNSFGKQILFDGVDDYINIPHIDLKGKYITLMLWFNSKVRLEQTGESSPRYYKLFQQGTGYEFQNPLTVLYDKYWGRLYLYTDSGNGYRCIDYDFDPNVDYFLVIEYCDSTGETHFYVNNEEIDLLENVHSPIPENSDPIHISHDSHTWNGTIDQVALYVSTSGFVSSTDRTNTYNFNNFTTTDLAGLWLFDEGEGNTVHDSSGNGNDGTRVNFSSESDGWVDGQVDGALYFDGVDDYVVVPYDSVFDIPHPETRREITIVMKVWIESNGGMFQKWDYDGSEYQHYRMYVAGGEFYFGFYADGQDRNHHIPVAWRRWVTLAASYDGERIRLYRDGTLISEKEESAYPPLHECSLSIGAVHRQTPGDTFDYFKGKIAGIWFYHRRLSDEEIKEIHEHGWIKFKGAYRREVCLDATIFPDSPNYIAGLFLFDVKVNDTRVFEELMSQPDEDDYWTIGDDYITYSRYIHMKPEWGLYAWYNVTIRKGKPYAEVNSAILNEGSQPLNMTYASFGFGAFSDLIYPLYNPFYIHVMLDNGTSFEHSSSTFSSAPDDYYVWRHSVDGGRVKYIGITGNNSFPNEFQRGLMIEVLNYTLTDEVCYSICYEKSVRVVLADQRVINPGESTPTYSFRVVPILRYLRSKYKFVMKNILANIESFGNVDVAMPASLGLVVYGLAQYADLTGDSESRSLAETIWNFYYLYFNTQDKDRIYYRSAIAFAAAGLLIDPNNQTYLQFATKIANYVMEKQETSQSSPEYGEIKGFGLDEQGWASLLLGKMYEITLNSTYLERRRILHDAVHCDPSSLEVYMLNSQGEKDTVNQYADSSTNLFRVGELLLGMLSGSSDSGRMAWNDPVVLTAVSMIYSFSNSSFFGQQGTAIECGNTETHSVALAGLYAWINRVKADMEGVYVKYTNSTLKAMSWSSRALRIVIDNPEGSTSFINVYAGVLGEPKHVMMDDEHIEKGETGPKRWIFNEETKVLTIFYGPHESEGEIVVDWKVPPPSLPTVFLTILAKVPVLRPGETATATLQVAWKGVNDLEIASVEFRGDAAAGWISLAEELPKTFTKNPAEEEGKATLKIRVSVPEDAEPGNYTELAVVTASSSALTGKVTQSGYVTFQVAAPRRAPVPPLPELPEPVERAIEAWRNVVPDYMTFFFAIFLLWLIITGYLKRR